MVWFKRVMAFAMIAMVAVALTSCERKITRIVSDNLQPLSCADCHDASNLITGKKTEWAMSVHGTGEAYERGTSASCAGCHSGNGFRLMVEAGLDPGTVTEGDPDPTRQDCRACHMIHQTYTMQDFALRTTAAVTFYADNSVTFSGGKGNLCANCHQPRRFIPDPVGGVISGISTHWGPHHGPQSAMLLGVAGAGVADMPSGHLGVPNTCVHCHLGESDNHTFEPEVATCQECHPSASNFDIGRVQTVTDSLATELGARLLARGLISENSPDGHPTVTEAPQAEAEALWNWLYVAHEDKSMGVHNHEYARALLEYGIAQLPLP